MGRQKIPHMLCTHCGAKVARDAYYCKKCEAVIDDAIAPGSKREDTRLISKLLFANRQHRFRDSFILAALIIFVITGIKIGTHYLSVVGDNNSSSVYRLAVDAPTKSLECRAFVCHMLVDVTNKSNQMQTLTATPLFVDQTGTTYKAADPQSFGIGKIYCAPKVSLTLQPHAHKNYIGLCEDGAPRGVQIVLVKLVDSSGNAIVTAKAATAIP